MARLVLHIGAHKTGTSYLQRLMFHNREALERDGIFYPDLGPNPAHHILSTPWIDDPLIPTRYFTSVGPKSRMPGSRMPEGGRLARLLARARGMVPRRSQDQPDDALLRRRGADALWRRLVADYAKRPGTLFLSGEPFSRGSPQSVDFVDLAKRTSAFKDVRIVYVLRRQPELLQSIWLQLSKSAAPPDFAQFVQNALHHHQASGVWLDHNRVLDMVRQGFASDQITVWDYDQVRRGPGGLDGAFLDLLGSTLGSDALVPAPTGGANHSPDPLVTWIACHIAAPQRPDAALTRVVADAVQTLSGDARTSAFSHREYAEVLRVFAPLNAALCQRLQPTQPGFSWDAGTRMPTGTICRDMVPIPVWLTLARGIKAQSGG